MRKVVSREYKFMLDHRAFADRKTAVESFWEELRDLAQSLGVDVEGQFDSPENR